MKANRALNSFDRTVFSDNLNTPRTSWFYAYSIASLMVNVVLWARASRVMKCDLTKKQNKATTCLWTILDGQILSPASLAVIQLASWLATFHSTPQVKDVWLRSHRLSPHTTRYLVANNEPDWFLRLPASTLIGADYGLKVTPDTPQTPGVVWRDTRQPAVCWLWSGERKQTRRNEDPGQNKQKEVHHAAAVGPRDPPLTTKTTLRTLDYK